MTEVTACMPRGQDSLSLALSTSLSGRRPGPEVSEAGSCPRARYEDFSRQGPSAGLGCLPERQVYRHTHTRTHACMHAHTALFCARAQTCSFQASCPLQSVLPRAPPPFPSLGRNLGASQKYNRLFSLVSNLSPGPPSSARLVTLLRSLSLLCPSHPALSPLPFSPGLVPCTLTPLHSSASST